MARWRDVFSPMWPEKQRVENLPDPGGAGGGSDVELAGTTEAMGREFASDAAPYVPPLPVPLTRLVVRPESQRGLDNRLVLTASDARTQRGFGFRLYAALVDNWADQWVFIHNAQRFIPPQTGGVTMMLDGTSIADVEWLSPPGVTQPAATALQQAIFTFFETQATIQVG